MPKAIVLIYRKTEQKGMLRSLPLPENRCRLEREVLPEAVSPCVQAQVAEAEAALPLAVPAVEAVLFQEVPAVEAVPFQEVPVVVAEAVLLREFTVERRVACLLPPKQRK